MLSAVRGGEGVEEAMLAESVARSATGALPEVEEVAAAALEEAEVVVTGGADDGGSMGGWLDASKPHRPEGGALAPKPCSRRHWDGNHGRYWTASGAAGWKGDVGVFVGNETRVGDPLLRISQGHMLVPGCLVLGGLQGGGRGHDREVLAGAAE